MSFLVILNGAVFGYLINYIGNMMALEDAKAENAFECIFLNEDQILKLHILNHIF